MPESNHIRAGLGIPCMDTRQNLFSVWARESVDFQVIANENFGLGRGPLLFGFLGGRLGLQTVETVGGALRIAGGGEKQEQYEFCPYKAPRIALPALINACAHTGPSLNQSIF